MIDKNLSEVHSKQLVNQLFLAAEVKGISQQLLSDLTGFKQESLSRIKSGKFHIKLPHFIHIAKAIGINKFFFDLSEFTDEQVELLIESLEQK